MFTEKSLLGGKMMAETLKTSWVNDNQLNELAKIKRDRTIIKGAVTAVSTRETKVLEDGKYVKKQMEVATFLLEGTNITAYCPSNEFSDHDFRSLNGFTGSIQEVIVDQIDIEDNIVLVSVRKADDIRKAEFMKQLVTLEAEDSLKSTIFDGVVRGYNPNTRKVFVRINGADCFMNARHWSWENGNIQHEINRGETIQVKVLRFDKENNLIQVSRRDTQDDPFKKLIELYNQNSTVAGKVTNLDPIHGIFVKLDAGLEVKGIRPRHLPEPVVGDIVSCTIRSIDKDKRHAKVTITGYPRGKKKIKDVASFLFE